MITLKPEPCGRLLTEWTKWLPDVPVCGQPFRANPQIRCRLCEPLPSAFSELSDQAIHYGGWEYSLAYTITMAAILCTAEQIGYDSHTYW